MQDPLKKFRIAVFVSGGGSNLQALIDASEKNELRSEICLVLSSDPSAFALERAKKHRIEAVCLSDEDEILAGLERHTIDLIVLAGYLKIIGAKLLTKYKNRMINIHPSLLPRFGGMGMYGMNVHRAVFAAGETVSGATVHFVDKVVDGGERILQREVDIRDCASPEEIQEKVIVLEHQLIVDAVKLLEER